MPTVKITAMERVEYFRKLTLSEEDLKDLENLIKDSTRLELDEILLDPIRDVVCGEVDPFDVQIEVVPDD